jgi:putative tricarboxylic transport membrane protein
MFIKNRKDLLSGFFFLALGIFIAVVSVKFSIWSQFGPDEGFIPLITAVLIAGPSLILILKSVNFARVQENQIQLEKKEKGEVGTFRVASYMILTMLYGLLFEKGGFLVSSALFLLFIIRYIERQGWRITAFVGLASIITSYLLFVYFLEILLPRGLLKWW